jgi:hypothetical protein
VFPWDNPQLIANTGGSVHVGYKDYERIVLSTRADGVFFQLARDVAYNGGAPIHHGYAERRVGDWVSATRIRGDGTAVFTPGGLYPYDPNRPLWEVGPSREGSLLELPAREEVRLTSSTPARRAAPDAFHMLHDRWPDLLARHGLDPQRVVGPQSCRQAHAWPPEDLALVAVLYDTSVRDAPSRARQRTLEELHRLRGEGATKWTDDRLKSALRRARTSGFLGYPERRPADQLVGTPRKAGGFVLAPGLAALAPEHEEFIHPDARITA